MPNLADITAICLLLACARLAAIATMIFIEVTEPHLECAFCYMELSG